ncbi:NAD-dependent epimerase/dehydratase family protein [Vibrio cholerae]|uniref:NAD-dependent epimerase/dehydratase family protein n=1 Tax=Vibrio cholerae TaxID=666 RepID=UPI00164640F4|nr:NAD-dependent epimerase/dehydratase family protein [Vibrio cholerae]
MIILTGSTGFIGSELTKSLVEEKFFLLRLHRTSFLNDKCIYIRNPEDLNNYSHLLDEGSVIIHLAGIAHTEKTSSDELERINVNYPVDLFKVASNLNFKRFVFVSSIGVNGSSTNFKSPYTDISNPSPHNKYSDSKYRAELKLKELAISTNIELVIVRPTLVYGPNAPGNFGSLVSLISKSPFLPFGLAHNKRSFISVQNLVDLLITCAKHPCAAGNTFLASEGQAISIKEFTDAIAKGLSKKVIQLPIPVELMRFLGALFGKSTLINQLFGNLEVDPSNIQKVLGWNPPLTMEQAMSSLKKWENKQ